MKCQFTFVCNGEPPVTTDDVTVNVDPMGANVINSIESALRGQHQRMKPGSYLEITSITCEGLTTEDGDTNLYNKRLMKFEDSRDVYYFTIIGKYDYEKVDYKAMANQERERQAKEGNSMFGSFFTPKGGRRRSRKSRKSRKSRRR